MRKVLITGLGVVSPIGNTIDAFWGNLVDGVSGIRRITAFDPSHLRSQIAGEVRDFDPQQFMDRKAARRMQRFSQFAVACASLAVEDAGLTITPEMAEDVGVIINTGGGGIGEVVIEQKVLQERGAARVSPFFITNTLYNMASCQVSIHFGTRGPVITSVAACASGIMALAEGMRMIQCGDAEVVIAGGTESVMDELPFAGLGNMRALSTRNDEPERASRPFDLHRDGFVFGEGAGVVILESEEHALKRDARVYAELAGSALTSDAFHLTEPEPEGKGAILAMRRALRGAGLQPDEIDYICAHGTATPANDAAETNAIKAVFGEYAYRVPISSPKSMVGHLLGAAGAISALTSVLSIHTGIIPPTINLETPDPACDLDYVPNHARRQAVRASMANSFGFGGQNAVAVFRKP